MKKSIALLLAVLTLCTVFAFTACKKDDGKGAENDKGPGTFVCEKYKFVGDTEWSTDTEWKLVLGADGEGTSSRDGEEYKLTWKLDGEKITVTETFLTITLEYTGTLKDGVIDLFNGDPENDLTCEYIFSKK